MYRTVWEIPQKNLINMAADRGAYIDQSQSLNIHLAEPTFGKMSSMHFYAWKKGLKTGLYYLRTRPAADPIKFTVDKTKLRSTNNKENEPLSAKTLNSKQSSDNLKAKNGDSIKQEEQTAATTTNGKDVDNAELIEQLKLACSLKNKEACLMCSS